MPKATVSQIRKSAEPQHYDSWPVYFRVVAPACGSYDHDMVFIETEDEAEARSTLKGLLSGGHPVRLERVQAGPLPAAYRPTLQRQRELSPQNAGTTMRPVIAGWVQS